jgi:hypothetical protein
MLSSIFENWQFKLVALGLALLSWYFLTGRERVDTWVELPVNFVNVPGDLVIRGGRTAGVEVRLRGPRGIMRNIDEEDSPYLLDMSDTAPGENLVVFDPADVNVPGAVEVMEFSPPRLTLQVEQLLQKRLPVIADIRDATDTHHEIAAVRIDPQFIVVRGPMSLVEPLQEIKTQSYSFNATTYGMLERELGLDLPEETEAEPPRVEVSIEAVESKKTVWVKLPVRVSPVREHVAVHPEIIQVQVETPSILLARQDYKLMFDVYVQLQDEGVEAKSRFLLPYNVDPPRDTQILKMVPEKIEVLVNTK